MCLIRIDEMFAKACLLTIQMQIANVFTGYQCSFECLFNVQTHFPILKGWVCSTVQKVWKWSFVYNFANGSSQICLVRFIGWAAPERHSAHTHLAALFPACKVVVVYLKKMHLPITVLGWVSIENINSKQRIVLESFASIKATRLHES